MDELLGEFLTECFDSLTVLDVEVVTLEQNPNNPELISSIFRIVHTIKGTCGFLGLPRLERVAHSAENMLGKFRDGEMEVTPQAVTLILKSLDQIKYILDHLEQHQSEPEGEDTALISEMDRFVNAGGAEDSEADASAAVEDVTADEPESPQPALAVEPGEGEAHEEKASVSETQSMAETEPKKTAESAAPPSVSEDRGSDEKAESDTKDQNLPRSESVASQSLRVPVELLETLMTLVSELVLTRNQLLQMVRNNSDSAFKTPLQRLSHITSELQEGVMKTRMQPIGNAWSKLPRIIRDLSLELNKQIVLEMHGAETELDRQVLDLIKDPLTHMVRNSADHGLERPEERRAAGKSEKGKVTLNAFHEGGHIIIQISDDGRGLDTDKIAAKALQNNLTTDAELVSLSQQQIMQFIFKPGFSTAEKVTNVSGRGVGMDVVRTNIEKIGGSIELQSTLGKGSIFTIKIPLTLAIVSALIVESSSERFAIPQIGVVELVRAGANSEHRIEVVDGAAILRLRDRLLPLMSLSELLELDSPKKISSSDDAYIVVSQVGTCIFGLVVDQVFDTEEIVVKPVAPILRHVNVFSGNTILGDGSVVMILDLNGITGSLSTMSANVDPERQNLEFDKANELTSLLLFRAGTGAPTAVPLALVTRLEEVSSDAIEWSGNHTVMQYRDQLMPLTDIHGQPVHFGDSSKPVLVFSDVGKNMGLVVDEIIDITEAQINLEMKSHDTSALGTAIIAGHSTDLLDVSHFVNTVFGGWFEAEEVDPFQGVEAEQAKQKLLMVDDSAFFRNMLTPMLEANGYEVLAVESPKSALKLRENGEMYDLIISDIEMPEMDGFAFAAACREDGSWQKTPMIALTSHTTPKDIERGRAVGFTDYVGKLDRDALLDTISACFQLQVSA